MSRHDEMFQGPFEEGTAVSRRSVLERSLGLAVAGTVFGGLELVADLAAAQQQPSNAKQATIRVVITGNNVKGRSYVVSDKRYPAAGLVHNLFKTTPDSPMGAGGAGDLQKVLPTTPSTRSNLNPPIGGSHCLWVVRQAEAAGPNFKPGWHRTETVDYRFQISGEILCMLDEGQTTLGPGDVLINRNANHAWRAVTDNAAFVILVPLPKPT